LSSLALIDLKPARISITKALTTLAKLSIAPIASATVNFGGSTIIGLDLVMSFTLNSLPDLHFVNSLTINLHSLNLYL
jgi:hypothetical protein